VFWWPVPWLVPLLTASFAWAAAEVPESGQPATAPARVEQVVDGDTVRIRTADGQRLTLRLLAIDTPEIGQPGGAEAARWVADVVCGIDIRWESHGHDRYGRTVASIYLGEDDLAVRMLREGLAWRLSRFLRDQPLARRDAYEAAWQAARREGRGLWSGVPQPPWEWRQSNPPRQGSASIDCSDHRR